MALTRAELAKACDVDESWFDGWTGEPIGIYPARASDSGKYERGTGRLGPADSWVLDNGMRKKNLTTLQASRVRYALDRLCVPHLGRPPVKLGA